MAKDKPIAELNPRVEAQRVEAVARKAERERLFGQAQAMRIRGGIPDAQKGYHRYVCGEDCVTPDGVHHRAGEVVLVKKEIEPSLTWCPLDEHSSQQKAG